MKERLPAQWVGNKVGCASPPLAANNIRSHSPGIPPLLFVSLGGKKVCYVEYSEARNREEHPAQIKLTDQRRRAVTRGSALALQHGGRVPGIQLGQVRCQIPSLCRLPKPSTPSVFIKSPRCDSPPLPLLSRRYQSYLALSRLFCSLRM